jgi:hypothetical protein
MCTKLVFAAIAATAALAVPLAAGATPAPGGSTIVFLASRDSLGTDVFTIGADGSGLHRLTYGTGFKRQPVWSPDRSQIAFSQADSSGNFDIWDMDAGGGNLHRVTTDPGYDDYPQWTPDGHILYQHESAAWIVNADGSGARALPTGSGDAVQPTASPKGDRIAFSSDRAQQGVFAIYTMRLDGKSLTQVTFPTAGEDTQARFSPGGNDLAFIRDGGAGDADLYVLHGSQVVRLTSTPSRYEYYPSWNGSRIIFSGFGSTSAHSYSIPSTGGAETQVATLPQAPFTESFDRLDPSLWHTISDPGGTVDFGNGRLVESISGSATPGGQYNQIDEHVGLNCSLNGDFDYQVNYSLLVWPQFGGVYAGLHAFFANGSIVRNSSVQPTPYNQNYAAWTDGSFGSETTTDTSGTMRLVRVGQTLSAYFLTPSGWQLVNAGTATNAATLGIGLSAPGDQFAHQNTSVRYDTFRLNSGALTCPSWWADWGASASS